MSSKAELRAAILAARRAVPSARRDVYATALRGQLTQLVGRGETICAYVPVGSEPGAAPGAIPGAAAMVDDLVKAGVRVLLPVARHDESGIPRPLQWGAYRPGTLVAAPFGLREPAPPWLPAEAVAEAAVVLVPALAVDRAGVRLGRGAGFYDRTLRLADPAARRIAVVRDEELVDRLPAEPHDVAMTHALTPGLGLIALG